MPSRQSRSVLHRALGAALSGLILTGILAPGAAFAGPGGPPVAVDDEIVTIQDTPATGNVLDNDSNLGEGTLSVSFLNPLSPTVGTLDVEADGDYTFTPAPGFVGAGQTWYRVVNDKHPREAFINITVNELEQPPVADDDTVSVDEDTATDLTAEVLDNDSDGNGDTLTITGVSNVSGGQADVTGGVLTFTPDADSCGDADATFDYTISDGTTDDTASVTVNVTCVNDGPSATDDDASGTEDTDLEIVAADLTTNDSDIDDATLTVTDVGSANGGSVTLDAGTITFTPAPDLCGNNVASFDYTVDDGDGGTDTGTVTIDLDCVNDAPVADDDTLTGDEDTDVVASSGDLTSNDSDVDEDDLTVVDVDNAVGGTVSLDEGVITFTPDAESCGEGAGSFDYVVSDGTATDTGTVTVDIDCVNDNPDANDDEADGTEDQDVVIAAADLTGNDSDVEDVTLTVTGVDNASGGTVDLDGDTITFTPDADLCGDNVASFEYTVEDPDGGTATGTVTIDLDCVNDDPIAGDDTTTIVEDTATDVTAGLLNNDSDVDETDTLSITDVDNAVGGSVDLDNGVVTFTPTGDLCGDDAGSFDYELSDGTSTDTGHVTVDITCVNDAPVAVDDEASGTEDTDVEIDTADLLEDDSDVDTGDTLTLSAVSNPTGGTVELDGDAITFTPTANLCGDGVAGFAYTVGDGTALAAGNVTIDLVCVNDAPVAVDDTASIEGNTPAASYDVLDNDTDIDEDELSIDDVSVDPAQGTASVVDGEVEFTPATNFAGMAVITYVVTDGELTDTGTLTIQVDVSDIDAPAVVAPRLAFATGRVDSTAPVRVSWSATDAMSGVAGYELQVSIAGGAFQPVYEGTATSVKVFLPFKRTLVFRVRATDGVGNESAWATAASRKISALQNSSKKLDYRGRWRQVGEPRSSGAGHAYTTEKGASLRTSFTAFSVLYVTPKVPTGGKVQVFIDGKSVGTFNLQSSPTKFGKIITGKTWATKGQHRIRVVAVNATKQTTFDTFLVLK